MSKAHGTAETCGICSRGPAWAAICDQRRSRTALYLMGSAARGPDGEAICFVCLRVVPEDRVYASYRSPTGVHVLRIKLCGISTGYELLCCGYDTSRDREEAAHES